MIFHFLIFMFSYLLSCCSLTLYPEVAWKFVSNYSERSDSTGFAKEAFTE